MKIDYDSLRGKYLAFDETGRHPQFPRIASLFKCIERLVESLRASGTALRTNKNPPLDKQGNPLPPSTSILPDDDPKVTSGSPSYNKHALRLSEYEILLLLSSLQDHADSLFRFHRKVVENDDKVYTVWVYFNKAFDTHTGPTESELKLWFVEFFGELVRINDEHNMKLRSRGKTEITFDDSLKSLDVVKQVYCPWLIPRGPVGASVDLSQHAVSQVSSCATHKPKAQIAPPATAAAAASTNRTGGAAVACSSSLDEPVITEAEMPALVCEYSRCVIEALADKGKENTFSFAKQRSNIAIEATIGPGAATAYAKIKAYWLRLPKANKTNVFDFLVAQGAIVVVDETFSFVPPS